METLMQNKLIRKWQAVAAVLPFVFLAAVTFAGVADDLEADRQQQDMVQTSLESGVQLKEIVTRLDEAGTSGSTIICSLFKAGEDHAAVIAAALDAELGSADVAGWADTCGASLAAIQSGFSMAGVSLPGSFLFADYAEKNEKSAKEYLYNPPSQSK